MQTNKCKAEAACFVEHNAVLLPFMRGTQCKLRRDKFNSSLQLSSAQSTMKKQARQYSAAALLFAGSLSFDV
eukprot:2215546-Pleurochrysis_carterae.AAC.1